MNKAASLLLALGVFCVGSGAVSAQNEGTVVEVVPAPGDNGPAGKVDLTDPVMTSSASVKDALGNPLLLVNRTTAEFAASVAPTIATFAGVIAGDVLSVTAVRTGTIATSGYLAGTGVIPGTQILEQLSGTVGGAGTYAVSKPQNVAATTVSEAYATLSVSAITSGVLAIGQSISGPGVTDNTTIASFRTGTGGIGTYVLSRTVKATDGTYRSWGEPSIATVISNNDYQSGTPSTRNGILTTDGPGIFQSGAYGCESDDVTLAAISNGLPRTSDPTLSPFQSNKLEVMGGLCAGGFYNTYGGLDSVATYFVNQSPAPVDVDRDARFDKTHVYFSKPLTSVQMAKLHRGMVVRTSPLPIAAGSKILSPFQAVVTGVAADGSSLTIQQWSQPNDPTGASVGANPQGYAGASGPYTALVGIVYSIFGNNTIVTLAPGGGQDYTDAVNAPSERGLVGYEILIQNGYRTTTARSLNLVDPAFDVPSALGVHVVANGNDSVGFQVDAGKNILDGSSATNFEYGFLAKGTSFAAFDVIPTNVSPSYGFLDERLASNGGWPFAYVPQNYGHPGTDLKWGVDAGGTEWPSGIAFPGPSGHGSVPAAQIYEYGGTPGARNSGAIHSLAQSHIFYDPAGGHYLQVTPGATGVTLATDGLGVVVSAPFAAASGISASTVAAAGVITAGTYVGGSTARTTAAGSSQETATPAKTQVVEIVAGEGGVILPGNIPPGTILTIVNETGTEARIYPPAGGRISRAPLNAPYGLAAGAARSFISTRDASWWVQ